MEGDGFGTRVGRRQARRRTRGPAGADVVIARRSEGVEAAQGDLGPIARMECVEPTGSVGPRKGGGCGRTSRCAPADPHAEARRRRIGVVDLGPDRREDALPGLDAREPERIADEGRGRRQRVAENVGVLEQGRTRSSWPRGTGRTRRPRGSSGACRTCRTCCLPCLPLVPQGLLDLPARPDLPARSRTSGPSSSSCGQRRRRRLPRTARRSIRVCALSPPLGGSRGCEACAVPAASERAQE